MSHLKVIRVGGRSVLICGFSLFEDLRCCVAEIRWLGAAEQGELRDPSMSNPGKRNSCADTQPTSASVIFSRACSVSCPPLCENCPHPREFMGLPVSRAAVGSCICLSLPAGQDCSLCFCRWNVRVKAFSYVMDGLRFPSLNTSEV